MVSTRNPACSGVLWQAISAVLNSGFAPVGTFYALKVGSASSVSEPGAVATGSARVFDYDEPFMGLIPSWVSDPVASTTPRGLPARGPRSAPGSDTIL